MGAPDDERRGEVDLAAYAARVLERWWIVALAVIAAIVIAVIQSRGGEEGPASYEARAIVSLGVPLTSSGQLATGAYTATPLFAQTYTRQASVQAEAAAAAGLRPTQLRGRVSIQPVAGGATAARAGAPQIQVLVSGPWGTRQVAAAAQSLARQLVAEANRYPDEKLARLRGTRERVEGQVASQQALVTEAQRELDALGRAPDLGPLDRIAAQQPLLATISSSQSLLYDLGRQLDDAGQAMEQIESLEKARVVTEPRGVRVDRVSRQTSLAVAIVAGLVVGVLLALLAAAIRPRRRRGTPVGDAAA